MEQIKHFTFHEFIKSNQDIKKCLFHLPKDFTVIQNLVHLASIVDEIRKTYGKPIFINSGFRSEQYNSRVGGVPGSYHIRGRAVDIRPESNDELRHLRTIVLDYCRLNPNHGQPMKKYVLFEDNKYEVCVYDTFIHLAFKYSI